MVVDRYRKHLFGRFLANDVVIEKGGNLSRLWQPFERHLRNILDLFGHDVIAKINTFVTDVGVARTGNQFLDGLLPFAAETALYGFAAFTELCHLAPDCST